MHPPMTSLAQRVVALCDAYEATGDRSFVTQAVRLLETERDRAGRFTAAATTASDRGEAVAVARDRAQRFFRVYGAEDAQEQADARDAVAASRMRRERLAVDALAAFCAPLVLDSNGRAL